LEGQLKQRTDEKDELTKRNIQLRLKLLHAEFEKLNLQCMELNVSHVRCGHLNDDIDDLLDIVHDSSAKLEDDVSNSRDIENTTGEA
jgi:hypothetical protein